MNEISVSINKKNLNKIIHYAQAAYEEHKAEIGGMAVCVKGEDNEWIIKDPIILKQDITGTNCALDKEELSSYYLDVNNNKKYKKKDWRFLWWHSHHMMDSFWSGTDLNAIDEFNEGDLSFALVVNLKGDYLVRASAWNVGMHMDMDLNILGETISSVPKKIIEEVNDKCSTRTFVNNYSYGKNNNQLAILSPSLPDKEEEKFTNAWLKLVDLIEEVFSEVCSGTKSIPELKQELARANGKLTASKIGMRIQYSDINTVNDVMTIQAYETIEVDKKYETIHDTLMLEAADHYSWNWSYGLGRRYN
tara:strand:+ start:2584 stop:3498 length:915 start_codon:yes stop_codon:yes gene_type:complete